jgi:hypothetical protein
MRGLAGIGLPARIRDEAYRRVEREIRRKCWKTPRIERQQTLQSEKKVERDCPGGVKDEQRDGILGPFLLDRRIDPRQSVKCSFDRSEDRLQ